MRYSVRDKFIFDKQHEVLEVLVTDSSREVRVRKLSPEELREISIEKFDENEEIDSTIEE